ncbi:DUF4139 domain-containing protein [Pelagicoccus albus]|uniref:DUF4139 domain-containing protein n=1 Tax=Pelagicoccus albus TaxID=415222 RepID=A0A7X1B7K3_9BACT|nr:DUF4139 domain-containing protein [Pelagicoccus albus]MBC2605850.1 DUF4139 domain-containing protein [Pelagicoccus albus]
MQKTLFIFAMVSGITLANLRGEPLEPSSKISSVSLFRDGARITRVATLQAPAGKSTIRFDGLPTSVDYNTLEANIGEAKGVIRNARIFRDPYSEESTEIEAIRERLEAIRHEIQTVQQRKSSARARLDYVESLAKSFADGFGELAENGSSLSLSSGMETWELVENTRKEAADIEYKVALELVALNKKEKEIKQELQKAREQDSLTQSLAEVEIDLDTAQEVEMSISYQALSARWQPQYELRAFPEEARLDFGYFANVWQKTGEDWTDVSLSLHTNQTNRRGNVPELYPVVLSQHRPEYETDDEVYELSPFEVSAPRRKARLTNSVMAGAAPVPSQQSITVSASTVSFQVTLPGEVTVPSRQDASTLPVTQAELKAEYWSEVVPRVQLDTYLRARATNELDLPILAGQALAFVDGKLSSKVALEKTLPTEKIELSLGTDANIIAKRIEGAQQDKDTGLFDKTVTLTRNYTNKVTNYHSVPHKVVVVDQFPIATDAKIEIERLSPSASEIKVLEGKEDSGIFQWELTLAPKETKDLKLSYQVEHPRDWDLGPQL